MRTIKLLSVITLGEVSRYLVDASQGWELHGDGRIIESINALKRSLIDLGFKVAAEAAADLEQFKAEMEQHAAEATLSEEEERRLRSEMTQLRSTITAEAKTLKVYVLTEHRLDAKKLIESPKSFLGEDTFYRLPEIARSDFCEAGKCIVFELPTAAVFHILRAVEDTLRSYYGTFVKRGRMDKPLWGPIIEALRKKRKRKGGPTKALLDHLDNIRNNFRNPTDHPEMIYSMDEVQDLFGLAVDVLNRMATVLPDEWAALAEP